MVKFNFWASAMALVLLASGGEGAACAESGEAPIVPLLSSRLAEVQPASKTSANEPVVQPVGLKWLTGGCGDVGCGDVGCGFCEPGCGGDKLFGIFAPTDPCFTKFVSPITNPLFFEDPRTLTEIRTIFANHWVPSSNPVFLGGSAQYFAVQVRAALTERLSIIANKDGYIWINSNNEAAVPDNDGWADVAAGLKYNVVRDPENQFLLSSGFTYEIDSGSHQVFQGRGDGEFHLFASAGKGFLCDRAHYVTGSGFRLPTDTTARSQMWYWSNHVDYEVKNGWYGVLEANWFHWMNSGGALPVSFEGGDLFNLGSTDVAGNNIVTMGVGAKKRFGGKHELGVGYEFPLTDRKDILQSRLYLDLIVRF